MMHNPVAVFLFSIDHQFGVLNKIFAKLHIYNLVYPYPFEHYCVFCAKYISDEWWKPKSYFEKRRMKQNRTELM